jgi:hypothetical protein
MKKKKGNKPPLQEIPVIETMEININYIVLENQLDTVNDKYTLIVITRDHIEEEISMDIYTLSENPLSPHGVNMYSHSHYYKTIRTKTTGIVALDRKFKLIDPLIEVQVRSFPEQVEKAILKRLSEYIRNAGGSQTVVEKQIKRTFKPYKKGGVDNE